MQNGKIEFPAPLVAVANWLVPGAGYLMIGQTARGLTIGFTIITLFVLGILIGGIHVIDPPVFTPGIGNAVQLFTHKASAVLVKPAYIGQFLTGAIGLIGSWIGPSQPSSHARANDIGTLYTAIAGMLNLMATIDSAHRCSLMGSQSTQNPTHKVEGP